MDAEVDAGKLIAFRQIASRLAAGKEPLLEPLDPMVAGLSVADWFVVFADTHAPSGWGGWTRIEWPDGGAYAEQPNAVVLALGLVEEALLAESRRNSGSK